MGTSLPVGHAAQTGRLPSTWSCTRSISNVFIRVPNKYRASAPRSKWRQKPVPAGICEHGAGLSGYVQTGIGEAPPCHCPMARGASGTPPLVRQLPPNFKILVGETSIWPVRHYWLWCDVRCSASASGEKPFAPAKHHADPQSEKLTEELLRHTESIYIVLEIRDAANGISHGISL